MPDGAQLLDVRTAAIVAEGHLPGTIGIPVSVTGFANRAGFVLDPEGEVAILASSPDEGELAVWLLAAVGFTRLPLLDRSVLDGVRLERFRELADAELAGLDPTRPLATVCNSGVPAALAATLLARRGFQDVRPVLEGGIAAYEASITAGARAARG